MKRLQQNMIPESIVVVVGANGVTTDWVLEEGEGVEAVYAYYKLHYPECPIRVFYTGVMCHARPVEEVPLEKLKRPKYAEENLYITEPLDRGMMLKNPLDIDGDYNVDNGWQRLMAAKRDGWTTIPCRMVSR